MSKITEARIFSRVWLGWFGLVCELRDWMEYKCTLLTVIYIGVIVYIYLITEVNVYFGGKKLFSTFPL